MASRLLLGVTMALGLLWSLPALANKAPTAPGVGSPANGATVATAQPTLVWTAARDGDGDPLQYQIEVTNAAGGLVAPDWIPSAVGGRVVYKVKPILANGWYHRRARAFDGNVYGPWSRAFRFRVRVAAPAVNQPPSQPVATTPGNGATVTTAQPALAWRPATDPEGDALQYQIEVSTAAGTVVAQDWIPGLTGGLVVYNTKPLLTNGRYTRRARAFDGNLYGAWSRVVSFVVRVAAAPVNQPPSQPVATTPRNGATVTTAQPALAWRPATDPDGDALQYQIEVSTAAGTVVAQDWLPAVGAGGVVYNTKPLLTNGRYTRRARAFDGNLYGAWSRVVSFVVRVAAAPVNQPPTQPVATTPGNGATVTTAQPALAWRPATDPDGDALQYQIEVSTAAGTVVAQDWIPAAGAGGVVYNTKPLLTNGRYTRRARAFDGNLYGAWSRVVSFVVRVAAAPVNQPPSAPGRGTPGGGRIIADTQPTLSWAVATDPEGDALEYQIEVVSASGIIVAQDWITTTAGGRVTYNTRPHLPNGTYTHRARAFDGNVYGAWSPIATFRVRVITSSASPLSAGGEQDGGWSCSAMGEPSSDGAPFLALALLGMVVLVRRRRR